MKTSYFNLTIDQLLIRFYLMMLSVIVPVFIGIPILAILALPIFLSAMMGVQFTSKKASKSVEKQLTSAESTPQQKRA